MAVDLIVQNDDGDVADANGYITTAFFQTYHTRRGYDYSAYSADQQKAGVIKASDYLDTRFDFVGVKLNLGTKATGTLTGSGNFSNNETVTIGTTVWTFKSILTSGNQVVIGAILADSLTHLAHAINGDGVVNTDYATGNVASADVTATATATTLVALAKTRGTVGNAIATTETGANSSWGATTLTGGAAAQTTEWPRKQGSGAQLVIAWNDISALFPIDLTLDTADFTAIIGPDGKDIVGVPIALQRACAEYAFRALSIPLFQDAPAPKGGRLFNKHNVKVDVISEDIEYASPQSGAFALPAFPAADLLLARAGLIASGRRLMR